MNYNVEKYYRWFAWYPVKLTNGKYVWFQTVYRIDICDKFMIVRKHEYEKI
jgi:hypothetical protein